MNFRDLTVIAWIFNLIGFITMSPAFFLAALAIFIFLIIESVA